MSTESHCRLCALKFPQYHLKSFEQLKCEQLDIIVYKCLHIKINEKNNLPKTACIDCYNTIVNFHNFYNKVATAQKLLYELFIESTASRSCNQDENSQQWYLGSDDKSSDCDDKESKGNIFLEAITKSSEDSLQLNDIRNNKSDSNIKSEPVYYGDDNRWFLENDNCNGRSLDFKQESNFDSFGDLNSEFTGKSLEQPSKSRDKENNKLENNEFYNKHYDDNEDASSDLFDHFITKNVTDTPKKNEGKRKRSGIKRHTCAECGKSYIQRGHLATHMLTHVEGFPFSCDKCDKSFKTHIYLQNHLKNHLPKEIKNKHECDICQKKFSTAALLRRHKKTHEDTYDYTCEICGKCFHRKENLEDHKLTHSSELPYHCEQCPGAFKSLSRLKRHQLVHSDIKPHVCTVCGKDFREKRVLTQHQKIHSTELPFECEHCKKAFRKKDFLKQHLRQHTGERPYSCLECNHHFTNSANYTKHMKVRHGKITKRNNNNNSQQVLESGQNNLS